MPFAPLFSLSLSLSLFANLGDFKFSCPIFIPSFFFATEFRQVPQKNLSLSLDIHTCNMGGDGFCCVPSFGQLVWKKALALGGCLYKSS
jgi:hypothetical protein